MSKVRVELISEVKAVQDVPVVLCVYGFGTLERLERLKRMEPKFF